MVRSDVFGRFVCLAIRRDAHCGGRSYAGSLGVCSEFPYVPADFLDDLASLFDGDYLGGFVRYFYCRGYTHSVDDRNFYSCCPCNYNRLGTCLCCSSSIGSGLFVSMSLLGNDSLACTCPYSVLSPLSHPSLPILMSAFVVWALCSCDRHCYCDFAGRESYVYLGCDHDSICGLFAVAILAA